MEKTFKVDAFAQKLGLDVLYPGSDNTIRLGETELYRPGLQFTGYFNHFENSKVQIVGFAEYMYMEEKGEQYRKEIFNKYFSYDMPCIILTKEIAPHPEFLDAAKKKGIPVLCARSETTVMKQKIMNYLCDELAPFIERHGVLMDIYGVGVMLVGESGIGKSETALELVKRKHRLIADDVVKIKRISPTRLMGLSPKLIRYLLEIRGIGIIDVSKMYGVSSVIDEKKIDLVIELEMWQPDKRYERLGLHDNNCTNILDVDVPYMLIPVRSGRNLAIVVEAAARYFILRSRGINPAEQLEQRLLDVSGEELI